MTTARYAGAGLLLGVGWGVVGRVWMRLISTEPSFTWAGTLMLVGMAGIIGLLLGAVQAARARQGSRWWRLAYLLVPVFFAGAGLPVLPGVVLGGWAWRRGPVGRVLAALAVLSGPAVLLAVTWQDVDISLNPYPDNVFRLVIATGALVLTGTAAWASSIALGPWPRHDRRPVEAPSEVTVLST